jgi:DGQHR domain-containing protein
MENKIEKENIKIKQDNVEIIITSFNIRQLINLTKPDIYNFATSSEGYQRPINNNHVKGIMEYIRNEQYSILPTSMVMAIDKDEQVFKYHNSRNFSFNGYLRIVDGQHRIEAIRRIVGELEEELAVSDSEEERTEISEQLNYILEWEFPVNIMLLNKNDNWDRYVEIRAFVDINKKGKTVATDLADTNMGKIRDKLDELPQKQAVHQISLQVTTRLMKDYSCVWFDSIKTGDGENTDKIIGIGQFSKSIMSLSRSFLYNTCGRKSYYSKAETDNLIEKLYLILREYWNTICDNWKSAFLFNSDKNAYRVNYDFCIQKGIGVFPLHRLLTTEFMERKNIQKALENAKAILKTNKSSITWEDWEVGGTFTSYSSGSGYATIHKILRGQLNKQGQSVDFNPN